MENKFENMDLNKFEAPDASKMNLEDWYKELWTQQSNVYASLNFQFISDPTSTNTYSKKTEVPGMYLENKILLSDKNRKQ